LKRLKWAAKMLSSENNDIAASIIATDEMTTNSTATKPARMLLQLEKENSKFYKTIVRQSNIGLTWKGTGLGQILYDKAIQFAKKKGCRYFCSDIQRTMEAENAWKRLAQRYPVTKEGNYYIINLEKI
jgi:predicted GNAT family acetyltransferase